MDNVENTLADVVGTLSTYFVNLPPERLSAGFLHAARTLGEFCGLDEVCVCERASGGFRSRAHWSASGNGQDEKLLQDVVTALSKELPTTMRVGTRVVAVAPFFSGGCSLGGVVCISRTPREWPQGDLRALRLLAESMTQTLERTRTEEAKRAFLADIAHELRTPLSIIRATADVARGACAEASEAFKNIETEAAHLERVIDDLSFLAHSSSEVRRERANERVALAPLVESSSRSFAALAKKRGARITCVAEPCAMLGDEFLLTKAVKNLLGNAVRHGGGHIRVTLSREKGLARFSVADDGDGIAPNDLPHVFERLYRGARNQVRAVGGTGLGLAIVKSIVEAHSGAISVKSAPGAGSEFVVLLPLAE